MSSYKTYIALLRGINVSGQKIIKMADLRSHLSELGYENVQTYIQSGNVVFSSATDDMVQLEMDIAQKIKEKYRFEVPVLIKTALDFEEALQQCPYVDDPEKENNRIAFTFLAGKPESGNIKKLMEKDFSPEEWHIEGKNVFLYYPNGAGKAKLSNNFIESRFKTKATSRNLKTVLKLIEIANGS